ncbi:MAG TPA: ABC transporter permease [Mucilaginibacter sp.]|nr:ABC transporter permease [Mucilaginibacter sp.]
MIKNYLKVAWRNIWKNKVFSAINIIGLSIGMAACILIMLFVTYEKSFDSFHTKNIYKLDEVQKFPGMVSSQKVGLSMFPMGPALQADFPEVKDFTRIHWQDKFQLTYGEKRVFIPEAFFVDTTFLNIFDFKLKKGDRATALLKQHSVVLTEETAKKMFGDADPMGKTITHFGGDTTTYVVTGIAENVPKNSQLQFDALFSFNTIFKPWMFSNWGGNWLDTFLVLAPGTDIKAFEKKMPAYLKKHMGDDNSKFYELFYLPMKDVHANSADIGLDYLNFQKFDKNLTNLFLAIAVVVLIIACVNFINLSTARSAERAREVGIRKSIGAQRFQLAFQFLSETVLLSLFALFFAVVLVELALPFVNSLSRRELSLPIFSNFGLVMLIIGCTIVVGLISGVYPAAYLSGFQPVKVLKGSVESGKNKGTLRNVLVVGQFTVAIFLMIATVLVVKQLNFMQDKDPGFDRQQVVTVPLNMVTPQKYDLLKQQLLSSSLINGVTAAQDNLGSHLDQSGVEFKLPDAPKRQLTATRLIVDNDYLKLYKIKLLMGNNFSGEKSQEGREYIINEALAKELLKDHPKMPMSSLIGARFGYDSLGTIKAIAKNFNFNSLHYKIETLFILSYKGDGFSTMSVKINGGRTKEAVNFIKATWKQIEPELPFEYQFLDDHFNEVYQVDEQESKVVGVLAGLIIVISCLGLFGLASYSAEKRFKEIGIRKVLGASVQNITTMLSKNFLKLVFLANILAWPIAWLLMHQWLKDFAYRINIQWWVFVSVGVVSILIAFFTVSFQAIKAAIANPIKSLRSE